MITQFEKESLEC